MYLRFVIFILAEFSNFQMYQRFDQLFNKSDTCLSDLLNFLLKPMNVQWIAIALASEGHLRYFKAQKASEA